MPILSQVDAYSLSVDWMWMWMFIPSPDDARTRSECAHSIPLSVWLCAQMIYQGLNFGMIVASALMIWKGLMVVTGSESPIVVVLRCVPSPITAYTPACTSCSLAFVALCCSPFRWTYVSHSLCTYGRRLVLCTFYSTLSTLSLRWSSFIRSRIAYVLDAHGSPNSYCAIYYFRLSRSSYFISAVILDQGKIFSLSAKNFCHTFISFTPLSHICLLKGKFKNSFNGLKNAN